MKMNNKYKIQELVKIMNSEIGKLKENERSVVIGRFGIGKEIKSLAAIGRELKLSRERVRQIQAEALKKLSQGVVRDYKDFSDYIVEKMEGLGGIVKKDKALHKIIDGTSKDSEKENYLHLFLKLIPGIEIIERDDNLHDSWVLSKMPKDELVKVLKDWAKYLDSQSTPKKIEVLLSEHPDHKKHNTTILMALPEVSRKLIETYEGTIGLSVWPEVCPKTVRDKIYFILKRYQKPLHFREIARTIETEKFDQKKVVAATVHNELIADDRFVLIGRGIYALKEWGYVSGTVKDVIVSVMKKANKSMDFADIFKVVSKQRFVRKNTVLINLQTQKEFKKLESGKFVLA